MLTLRQRIRFTLIGATSGLVFGLAYWFGWGCHYCAKDDSPYPLLGFCALIGAVLVSRWAPDHIHR